ncbi:hypothetical protein ACE1CD_34850 [Aerosakkonema sp. BLCC-F183]|uniref:hypothetical protein n=1 Tax=Aerosakkonema sp. BLCC-F183 TaxID=3342834 RepID=UPI0035BB6891
MTPEQVKFLNEIAGELKTQSGFNLREEVFFPLRYDKNCPLTVQHQQIAQELMPKDSRLGKGDYATSIGTTSQNVVLAMVNLYKEEMEKDGVNLDILINGQKGQKGTWREAYYWLWNHKYLRWLDANSWEILQAKAKYSANWLQFFTEDEANKIGLNRGAYLELPPPEMPPNIPVNKKLWMAIDLEYPNYQLLLFNRSKQGTVLYCPSFGYAIDAIMDKPPFLLPQKYSWAGKTGQKFIFKETGKEEFLAIVLENSLHLSWLTPKREEALPEWNVERIKELFEELEKQSNWQVFYQSFEVVE